MISIILKFILLVTECAALHGGHDIPKCYNIPNWQDKDGVDCLRYEKQGICQNNGYHYNAYYFSGKRYNFPELNCCACGKAYYYG